MRIVLAIVFALTAALFTVQNTFAQVTGRLSAITATSAPVYVLPDNTRTPLRVLAPATRLRVLREQGDWLRVEFDDPRWGRRVGYIERKNVDMSGPETEITPAKPRPRSPTATPPPAPKTPRTSPRSSRPAHAWVDVNFGVARAGEESYSSSATRQINGQDATFRVDYHLPVGLAFDIGGGVMATRQIGVGATFSTSTQNDPAELAIDIPHPLLTNANATDTGSTDRDLTRSEGSLHIHGVFVSQTSPSTQVRVFGGPTFFRVRQDAVQDIRYDQQFLPFEPVHEVEVTGAAIQRIEAGDATGWGFHVGADFASYMSPIVGFGIVFRYSRGTVEATDPLSSAAADLDVGGFHAGAGVRLRF
jgi:hypothetical protein